MTMTIDSSLKRYFDFNAMGLDTIEDMSNIENLTSFTLEDNALLFINRPVDSLKDNIKNKILCFYDDEKNLLKLNAISFIDRNKKVYIEIKENTNKNYNVILNIIIDIKIYKKFDFSALDPIKIKKDENTVSIQANCVSFLSCPIFLDIENDFNKVFHQIPKEYYDASLFATGRKKLPAIKLKLNDSTKQKSSTKKNYIHTSYANQSSLLYNIR